MGKTEKRRSLIDIFKEHNKKLEPMIGKEFTSGILRRYKTSLKHTQDFLKWKYNLSVLILSCLTTLLLWNTNLSALGTQSVFHLSFLFRLTEDEFKNLLFQNGRASWGGRWHDPNPFTEEEVAMLSGMLSSRRAIALNIRSCAYSHESIRYWQIIPTGVLR